jgi:2-polyprenyl-3-methyl-5-hydroxy-6-metoxy-1,4-benzoquinol methylase
MQNDELPWTGERLVTSINEIGTIEHLHRYAYAKSLVSNRVVLDIASGEGYGSNILATEAKSVFGVDISKEVITHSNIKYQKDNLSFVQGDVTKIPFDNAFFDVVVSFETIEHVSDQEAMLKEIKRVLKPEGIIIISSPEKANYGDINEEKNPFHVHELYFEEFSLLLEGYFRYCSFYFQKEVYGTLITPMVQNGCNFYEYSGDFESIRQYDKISNPIFNICVASDYELKNISISFFEARDLYNKKLGEQENAINSLITSRNFRVGKFILQPIRIIRNWIKG